MRSVVESIMAGSGRACLLASAFFVTSSVVSLAQIKQPPAVSAEATEKVETYLDSISGRGAARRKAQTTADRVADKAADASNLRDMVIESGAVVRYLMAKNELSAGEIQYVNKYVNSSPAAAAPLLVGIDSQKVAKFVETVEVQAWNEAQKVYLKAADPNYGKKFVTLAVRIGPFRTADGSAAEMVYVDWKNNGDKPVMVVFAKVTTYDAKGRVIHSSSDECIYSAPFDSPGIAPGDTYIEPDGQGSTQPFVGVPKIARAVVVIRKVSDKRSE